MTSPIVAGLYGFKEMFHGPINKTVRYMREHGDFKKILHASGDDTMDVYCRFYVELSKEHKGQIHIRCCYNNKYWVAREVNNKWYIFCDADKPVEDPSNPECTLFEASTYFNKRADANEAAKDLSRIRFTCVGDKPKLYDFTLDEGYLTLTRSAYSRVWFLAIPLGEDKALPKYVRLKGDNGKYLGTTDEGGEKYLKFGWTDSGEANLTHTIVADEDAKTFSIKANKVNMFWTLADNDGGKQVRLAADNDAAWKDRSFRFVRLGENVVAIKNVGNNMFVKRLPDDNLGACEESITALARLQIEEAVISRKIFDVEYHFTEARIYDKKALIMATEHAVNRGSTPNTAKINLTYSTTEENTWTNSTTVTWGVNATIHVAVPKILKWIGVDLGADIEGHYERTTADEFGKTHARTEEQSVEYQITVPPNTKVTLSLLATQASCDIPYSYVQKDLLTNGETFINKLEDGIYHGVNNYDFTCEVTEEVLDAPQKGKAGGQITQEVLDVRQQGTGDGQITEEVLDAPQQGKGGGQITKEVLDAPQKGKGGGQVPKEDTNKANADVSGKEKNNMTLSKKRKIQQDNEQ